MDLLVFKRHLFLSVAPYIKPFEFGTSTYAGESIQILCQVLRGDLPVTIRWQYNGHETASLPSTFLSTARMNDKVSILSIPEVDSSHIGNYTCIAENLAASDSYTGHLSVIGTTNTVLFKKKKKKYLK